ncbi:hypothetical protein [Micromonospora orduensis]|uniref:hypothetical protein n=1 Tax=Micromonospora orduensis TaxID=1420891 RepID=UPI0033C75ECB
MVEQVRAATGSFRRRRVPFAASRSVRSGAFRSATRSVRGDAFRSRRRVPFGDPFRPRRRVPFAATRSVRGDAFRSRRRVPFGGGRPRWQAQMAKVRTGSDPSTSSTTRRSVAKPYLAARDAVLAMLDTPDPPGRTRRSRFLLA